MAKDTYLEMVTDLIVETGLNAGQPPLDVATAEGDAAKVCYWIQVADLQLQRERIDWDFLWSYRRVNLQQGRNTVSMPLDRQEASTDRDDWTYLINAIAKDKLAVLDPDGSPFFPQYMPWEEFSILYNYQTQAETNYPSFWSMRPDRRLLLSSPMADAGYKCQYEYWRKPLKLRNNDDTSRIPDDFGRLIILLAKTLYAEHEDAPEVKVGSSAHYDVMFNQMLSVHAPEAEWQRMENSDQYLAVETR